MRQSARDVSILELEAREDELPHGSQLPPDGIDDGVDDVSFDLVDEVPPDDPHADFVADDYPAEGDPVGVDVIDIDPALDTALDVAHDSVPATLEEAIARAVEAAVEAALASARDEAEQELELQRDLTRQAVGRYREALLAAEPELPPDLVRGESIEEIDTAAESARAAVQRIREAVVAEQGASGVQRSFPTGAPARTATLDRGRLSTHQKIAAGLQERML